MDAKLSEFITRTTAEPGLARDLLEAHEWNLGLAIQRYYEMKGIVECSGSISSRPSTDAEQQQLLSSSVDAAPSSRVLYLGIGSKADNNIYSPTNHHNGGSNSSSNNGALKCLSEPSLSSPISPVASSAEDPTVNASPSKLAISKQDLSDMDMDLYPKKLVRGISRATDNVTLVSRARTEFAQDFRLSSRGSRLVSESVLNEKGETPDYTFTLPDLTIHSPDFADFLERDLIEKSTLVSLEGAGRLNWWADINAAQRLLPLATSGDGNCLLHAASLGMWGFHDRLLTLRKTLHSVMSNSDYTNAFYRRWRWQSSAQNREAGLILCEDEWEREWQSLLKMASTEPRLRAHQDNQKNALSGGKKVEMLEDDIEPHVYESLEEVHILALAHVLKRPIIVIADTMLKDVSGEPFAPIPFGGIFLPLECNPSQCAKSPLLLTYDNAHFSALVAMEMETFADRTPQETPPAAVPIVDSDRKLLPVQFVTDPGVGVSWSKDENSDEFVSKVSLSDKRKLELLEQYLDIKYINLVTKKVEDRRPDIAKRRSHLEKSVTLPSNFEFEAAKCDQANTSPVKSDCASASGNAEAKKEESAEEESQQPAKDKSRTIQSLGRRFGSLGRSFSKKIRKNLSSIARRSSFRSKSKASAGGNNSNISHKSDISQSGSNKGSSEELDYLQQNELLIVAMLRTEKRHDYQEEMILNYLKTARTRFLKQQQDKEQTAKSVADKPRNSTSSSSSTVSSSSSSSMTNTDHYVSPCVNNGCKNYGSASTSYLCPSCHKEQHEAEMERDSNEGKQQDQKPDSTVSASQSEQRQSPPDTSRSIKEEAEPLKKAEDEPGSKVPVFEDISLIKCASQQQQKQLANTDLIDNTSISSQQKCS